MPTEGNIGIYTNGDWSVAGENGDPTLTLTDADVSNTYVINDGGATPNDSPLPPPVKGGPH